MPKHSSTFVKTALAAAVALVLSAVPAHAGVLHFCSQTLAAGSYCNSSSTSNPLTAVYGTADGSGAVSVKAFLNDGSSLPYVDGFGWSVLCVSSPLIGGYGRVRNTGGASHYYTGITYSWPDSSALC